MRSTAAELRKPLVTNKRAPGREFKSVSDRGARPVVVSACELVTKRALASFAPGGQLREDGGVPMKRDEMVFHLGVPAVERT